MSACRSCGAAVVWGLTKTGKRMPVDAAPVIGGNVVMVAGNDGPELLVLAKPEVERRRGLGLPTHTSHFATCPHAAGHRK